VGEPGSDDVVDADLDGVDPLHDYDAAITMNVNRRSSPAIGDEAVVVDPEGQAPFPEEHDPSEDVYFDAAIVWGKPAPRERQLVRRVDLLV
jgi:hypothetical protein